MHYVTTWAHLILAKTISSAGVQEKQEPNNALEKGEKVAALAEALTSRVKKAVKEL